MECYIILSLDLPTFLHIQAHQRASERCYFTRWVSANLNNGPRQPEILLLPNSLPKINHLSHNFITVYNIKFPDTLMKIVVGVIIVQFRLHCCIWISFFLSNTTVYQITEFIGHTVSLHVSAHRAIIRRYTNKSYTIELRLLYGSIYCAYRCVLRIKWKIWCASLTSTNHLCMHRLSGCDSISNLDWFKMY
jgi:hypothetical protein